MLNRLRETRGSSGVDIAIIALILMMFIGLGIKVFPAFMLKNQLDNFASDLIREAEISGRVAGETSARADALRIQYGINPAIAWDKSGKIQLNTEVTVTLTTIYDLGFFVFGSWPITLKSKASGKSEVYCQRRWL